MTTKAVQPPFANPGNLGRISELPLFTFILHVDAASGDDDNDGRTAGTAFATVVRALEEVPNEVGATGYVIIQLHGAGPYSLPQSFRADRAGQIFVYFLGDFTDVEESFAGVTWSAVASTETYYTASVGAFTTVPANGTHVMIKPNPFAGLTFYSGPRSLDAANTNPGAGTVRAVSSSAPPNGDYDLVRLQTVIYDSVGDNRVSFAWGDNIVPAFQGCIFDWSSGNVSDIRGLGAVADGCIYKKRMRFRGGGGAVFGYTFSGEFLQDVYVDQDISAATQGVSGLVLGTMFVDGGGWCQGVAVRRGAGGASIAMGQSGGATEKPSAFAFSKVDIDPTGVADGIDAVGPCTVKLWSNIRCHANVSEAMHLKKNANFEANGNQLVGTMKTPILVESGSRADGIKGSSGAIANTVTPGDEIKVGDAAIQTLASLPTTDGTGQLCRAT